MRDAERMRTAEPATSVTDDARGDGGREPTAALEQLGDVLALQILHRDVQAPRGFSAEIEHVDDVSGLLMRAAAWGFERKATAVVLLIAKCRVDEFYRHVDIERQVACKPDRTHRTTAE